MKNSLVPPTTASTNAASASVLDRIARQVFFSRFQQLHWGEITLIDDAAHYTFGSRNESFPLSVTVRVHHPHFYRAIAFGGDVGAGEAYIQGFWTCNDLPALMRIIVRNRHLLDDLGRGWSRLTAVVRELRHFLRRNTKEGSRRNIAAHYDLGNDFFALFLDDTLTYSCALFEREDSTLYEASVAKNDRVCRKLQLTPQDHVLEIGAGWGSFAIHAAQHYGCRVTTTTISQKQFQLAQQRVAAAGLSERVKLVLQDYRDLRGAYDKLVSIEMIEAVGHQYLETFFRCCSNLLKPDGMMLLQSITIADQLYEHARRSVDFIKQYIFPGSFIPSVTAICNALTRATDLRVFHLEDQGAHYATTLRHWRKRLFANLPQVRAFGYPDTFIRMWEYYLCYCEGGFHERVLGDVQMVLTKPLSRRAPIQPPLRTP